LTIEANKVFEYLKEMDELGELEGETRKMKFIDEYRDAESAKSILMLIQDYHKAMDNYGNMRRANSTQL
jgi:hypothetical protein